MEENREEIRTLVKSELSKFKDEIKREMPQLLEEEMKRQLAGGLFTSRKLTATPTDDLEVVNRGYVTSNGTTFPNNPVAGQRFFSSVLSKPTYYNGTNWTDPTASIVG